MNYQQKYIKYKTKYLEKCLVVHISGTSGAGKTTLGNRLKDKYGELIYVKDMDDLHADFYQQNKIKDYQKYIDKFIKDHNDRHLIITGLTAEKCLGVMDDTDNTFYKIDTKYKYFIDIDIETNMRQLFMRQVAKLNDRKEMFFDMWLKDNDKTQDKLFRYVSINKWKSNNAACREIHREHGYEFMSGKDIFEKVSELVERQ
jgi:ABC-type oligopeptide transport system ATPase subunit